MSDILEAIRLFEAATSENPVKLRLEDGTGQHLDLLVSDATVTVTVSDGMQADEPINVSIDSTYEELE